MSFGDGTIDLRSDKDARGSNDEPEFKIGVSKPMENEGIGSVEAVTPEEVAVISAGPNNKVKVKFDKFVNLVATHAYEEVFEEHADEEIIISTDLLTDLANSHEDKGEKKMPLIFVAGIILGGLVAWFFIKF